MRIASNISWQMLEDNVYVINEIDNTIIKLENSAALIWKLLLESEKVDCLADKVSKRYNINREDAESDIIDFTEALIVKGYMVE